MKEHEIYLCTRPMLASRLMEQGFKATRTANPWRPDLQAWEFPVSADLCEVVAVFYNEIGKPVPRNVAEYLTGERVI